jgi:predicted O-linked N-acetylglucosamine transferase (SPINDLY family)
MAGERKARGKPGGGGGLFADATRQFQAGNREEAERLMSRAAKLDPENPRAHFSLGEMRQARGQLEPAAASYRHALKLDPKLAPAHNNLAMVLHALGKPEEALASAGRALALDPGFALALNMRGIALQTLGRSGEAEASLRRALALDPKLAVAHNNLGTALMGQGRAAEAKEAYRQALALRPGYLAARSNLLMCLQYDPGISPEELFREHGEYGKLVASAPKPTEYKNSREASRRLRIGYVSPDLRRHPVGYFLAPVLSHHDRDRFEAVCYYGHAQEDEVTASLKRDAKLWRSTLGLGNAELAGLIRKDGIDILVDLSGHTASNRLPVFAMKPAPVQASWAGYTGTTGLAEIDYLITDPRENPPGSEAYATEKLARLPEGYVCYAPPDDAPEVGPLPAQASGVVTFGCFNNLAKINGRAIALWAELLRALPGSRLLLKNKELREEAARKRVADDFAASGVDSERLILEGPAPHRQFLERYNAVDIALDPFPYSGGLTTLEALWMGVPVVTLGGASFAARHSLSHLNAAGLGELIAPDKNIYIAIALGLGRDTGRLAKLRAGMRARLLASPVTQAERFTRDLETAFRTMWRSWCGQ